MNKWLTCRRQWYYRYMGGIEKLPSTPLRFGNLLHAMMEQDAIARQQYCATFEDSQRSRLTNFQSIYESSIERAENVAQKLCNEFLKQQTEHLGIMPPESAVMEIQDEGGLAIEVFMNWLKEHGQRDFEDYDVLDVEKYLEGTLRSPGGKTSVTWKAAGKVDLLVRKRDTGEVFIREYKTTGGPCTSYERRLELDPQVRLYTMMLQDMGINIDGVEYIILRRRVPGVPKNINCRTCKGSGLKNDLMCIKCHGTGSTPSKAKQLDSVQPVVVEYLLKNNWNLEDYKELIDAMPGWEKFISVNSKFIEPSEISDVRGEIWRAAHEITKAVRTYNKDPSIDLGMVFPRNTATCSSPSGGCIYRELCIGGVRSDAIDPSDGWLSVVDSPEL